MNLNVIEVFKIIGIKLVLCGTYSETDESSSPDHFFTS